MDTDGFCDRLRLDASGTNRDCEDIRLCCTPTVDGARHCHHRLGFVIAAMGGTGSQCLPYDRYPDDRFLIPWQPVAEVRSFVAATGAGRGRLPILAIRRFAGCLAATRRGRSRTAHPGRRLADRLLYENRFRQKVPENKRGNRPTLARTIWCKKTTGTVDGQGQSDVSDHESRSLRSCLPDPIPTFHPPIRSVGIARSSDGQSHLYSF